jgi:3'(2'), 5'-bisphosphate nucleotidase
MMEEFIQLAKLAAFEAGKEIMKIYETDFSVETKPDDSPLTLADKAAHKKILTFLKKTNIPILSEEGKHLVYSKRKKWNSFWLVDPLDGTKEFVKRNGEFTVNIALIHNNEPVIGVIYVPVQDVMYYSNEQNAYKVENYSCSPLEYSLPLKNDRKQFVIVGSRSHMSKETELFFEEMRKSHEEIELLAVGSSLKLCMVAEGKADVYPRYAPTMEWDTGAGHALVKAAGFRVLQYQSENELVYNKENLLNPWFLVKK